MAERAGRGEVKTKRCWGAKEAGGVQRLGLPRLLPTCGRMCVGVWGASAAGPSFLRGYLKLDSKLMFPIDILS